LTVQVVAQALPEHTNGEQVVLVALAMSHDPSPSQVAAAVDVPFWHLGSAHTVKLPGIAQAAAWVPSQNPAHLSVPEHWVRFPCGLSCAAIGEQVPSFPFESGTSQASHWPSQALSQHTPSTQTPVAHCPPAEHAFPASNLGVHTPEAQKVVLSEQSVSTLQLPSQALPSAAQT
jgi:hypothetical protein